MSGVFAPKPQLRIGLYARSETRFFMTALARLLREQHGAWIVLYSGNAQETAFYQQHRDGAFDEIVEAKTLHAAARETPAAEAAEIERARAFEARIGCTINFLSVSNRHLGRGYALGGFNHPRSRISEETGYAHLLHAYNECLAFWDREIPARRLTLLMNGPREAALMARLHGVAFRSIAGSRHRNLHYWAHNEFLESPEFAESYRGLAETPAEPVELDAPNTGHLHYRTLFVRQRRALPLIKRAAIEVARYAYWRLRGYEKARGYYLRENLAYFYRIWSQSRRLHKLATTTLADIAGRPFVFYPLHLEPETALQGLSPEYLCQLGLITAMARELPAGVLLAVKEHVTALGRRPTDFHRQIAEFKNVVLVDPLEHGVACTKAAAATVTICGSAGFEAAVMGRPVMALGRHNIYGQLPHVRSLTDESQLGEALREALGGAFPNDRSRRDGARFLKAIVERSFDMRSYSYQVVDRFEAESVRDASHALLRGLPAKAAALAA
jgi:hypothetical protein